MNEAPPAPAPQRTRARSSTKLSKDGKWRSFPNLPNLLQYVPTEQYYGRLKIRGKLIRKSLNTNVWTDAKLRLLDFLKGERTRESTPGAPTFTAALALYTERLSQDASMKPRSREYRLICIRKIELSWPDLWKLNLSDITPEACRRWAANLRPTLSAQYFNNTIDTLKLILADGIKRHQESGGNQMANPACEIARARVLPKQLNLPESAQFKTMVASIRRHSGGWSTKAADLVEFLAYSGLRLYTEAQWVTWEDVDWKRGEIVVRGDPETRTKNWELRRIPMLPDMKRLLESISASRGDAPSGRVLEISRCPESLKRVCHAMGIPRISHHDLRHLFATRCIESGVDIPTVARWLGHKDGGALAMKTYGHLRNEHSQAMAQKVQF